MLQTSVDASTSPVIVWEFTPSGPAQWYQLSEFVGEGTMLTSNPNLISSGIESCFKNITVSIAGRQIINCSDANFIRDVLTPWTSSEQYRNTNGVVYGLGKKQPCIGAANPFAYSASDVLTSGGTYVQKSASDALLYQAYGATNGTRFLFKFRLPFFQQTNLWPSLLTPVRLELTLEDPKSVLFIPGTGSGGDQSPYSLASSNTHNAAGITPLSANPTNPNYILNGLVMHASVVTVSDNVVQRMNTLYKNNQLKLSYDNWYSLKTSLLANTTSVQIPITITKNNIRSVFLAPFIAQNELNITRSNEYTYSGNDINNPSTTNSVNFKNVVVKVGDQVINAQPWNTAQQLYLNTLKALNLHRCIDVPTVSIWEYINGGRFIIGIPFDRDSSSALTGISTETARNIVISYDMPTAVAYQINVHAWVLYSSLLHCRADGTIQLLE